jgi:hypothetical protein
VGWFDDVLWTVGFVAFLGGMYYVAYRIEPHWVSKDGHRFICTAQVMNHHGIPRSGWREYRVEVRWDGSVATRRRSRWVRADARTWRMKAKSDDAPKRKAIYLLGAQRSDRETSEQHWNAADDDLLAIRLPASSRAIPVLDALVGSPHRTLDDLADES